MLYVIIMFAVYTVCVHVFYICCWRKFELHEEWARFTIVKSCNWEVDVILACHV